MFTLVSHGHFCITMFLNNNLGCNKTGQIKPRRSKNMALTVSIFLLVTFSFEAMMVILLNSNTNISVVVSQLTPRTFRYV